jgi:hypothetical protein
MSSLDGLDPARIKRQSAWILIFVWTATLSGMGMCTYLTWQFVTSGSLHAIPMLGGL